MSAPESLGRRRWLLLVVLSPGVLINSVDRSTVTVALGDIASTLHASNSYLQWVLDSYNLTLASLVLLGSGLADRFGRKKVYLSGLLAYAAGSLVCALSGTAQLLIVGRIIMGAGAAAILPSALALISVTFVGSARKTAIATWGTVAGVGSALGPILGGVLLDNFEWQSIFWLNIPVILAAVIGTVILARESRKPGDVKLDVVGAVLSTIGLGALVYAVLDGPSKGWSSPGVVVAFVIGVGGLAAFIFHELRAEHPMFDVRVLRIPRVLVGALCVSCVYFILYAFLYLMPQTLQFVLGLSPLFVGLALLPLGLVYIVMSQSSPHFLRRFGLRNSLCLGLVAMAAGVVGIAIVVRHGYPLIALFLVILAFGLGLVMTPATIVVMDSLPDDQAGDGAAVNQIGRQLGGVIGVTIIGSIVSTVYIASLTGIQGVAPHQFGLIRRSLSEAENLASHLPGSAAEAVRSASANAYQIAANVGLFTMALVCLVLAVAAAVVLRRGNETSSDMGKPQ